MSFKKHIPNLITLLNLLSGCVAILFAVRGQLEMAAFFSLLGISFDFFDGLAARLLDAYSELGLQLDSLADMVTSGVVPGVVMFQLLSLGFGSPVSEVSIDWNTDFSLVNSDSSYWAFMGFAITLASAYRLAKFNIDTRQTNSFIGLPTPANTLLILSIPLILHFQTTQWITVILLNKWFLMGLTLVSCYLLNAEIPLFSLKFKTWGFKENMIRYLFLIFAILLLVSFQYLAIPCVILLYVLMSVFQNVKKRY